MEYLSGADAARIACVCHEANRVYCASVGDGSQPGWNHAPEWQKQSAVAGVRFVYANPDSTPADNHASWLAQKEAEGWRYGEVKNAEAKTHPCFLPYDQLPPEQQFKDQLFRTIAKTMLTVMGKLN